MAGFIDGILRGFGALPVIGAIRNAIPMVENEAIVEVTGEPGCRMADLYKLALSVAFGLVKNPSLVGRDVNGNLAFLTPPPGVLMIEYDAADRWVRCTLKYVNTTLVAAGVRRGEFYESMVVYRGPFETVRGADWNFTGGIPVPVGAGPPVVFPAPGIPLSAREPGLPDLPFKSKTVLTSEGSVPDPDPAVLPGTESYVRSPNPKPPGDNRSRGMIRLPDLPGPGADQDRLIQLVFAALSNPGSPQLEVFAQPTPGPTGG